MKKKGGQDLEKENARKEKEANIWKMILFVEMNKGEEEKGGSFASGWSIQIITCKRTVYPDNHLQVASLSR